MAWTVVAELIPDARAGASARAVGASLFAAFAAMMALQVLVLGV